MVSGCRAHLEASAERWSRLLGLLEELWRWICSKDEELAKQMPLGGDVPTLLQQQNYCTVRPAGLPPPRAASALSGSDKELSFIACGRLFLDHNSNSGLFSSWMSLVDQ